MRVRAVSALFGVLAIVGASVILPLSAPSATAAVPSVAFGVVEGYSAGDPYPTVSGTVDSHGLELQGVALNYYPPSSTIAATFCASVDVNEPNWSCESTAPLEHGVNELVLTATNTDGTSLITNLLVTFDATPTLTAPADFAQTNNPTPAFSGFAYPGSAIDVATPGVQGQPGMLLCSTTADPNNGAWSCSSVPLTDGQHQYRVSDMTLGIDSNYDFTITIDTTAPAVPVIGSPNGDESVDTDWMMEGASDPDVEISIYNGATLVCVATADSSGNWGCLVEQLPPGTHTFTATATDAVGNTSAPSPPGVLSIVTPTTITSPAVNATLASSRPTVTGTAHPGVPIEVEFYGASTDLCATTADTITGVWSCAPSIDLDPGLYSVSVVNTQHFDYAQTGFDITDTPPAITTPTSGTTTANARPMLSGTYAGDDVTSVAVQGSSGGGAFTTLCTAIGVSGGMWSCQPAIDLPQGVTSLRATASVGGTATGTSGTIAIEYAPAPAPTPRPTATTPPAPLPTPEPKPAPTPTPTPPSPFAWSFTISDAGTLRAGATVTMTAEGIPAGSDVTVELHSTPMTLGTTIVGPDGRFTFSSTIPDDVEPGNHTLVAILTPPGGVPSTATMPVSVEAAPAPQAPVTPETEPAPTVAPQHITGVRGEPRDVPRTEPAAPSAITESVPTAVEVVLNPVSLITAGGMALALLVLVALPTEILNTTLSANSRRFGTVFRRIDDATTSATEWLTRVFRSSAVPAVILIAATALVFSFSDPGFGFDIASFRLFLALGIALFIVTWVASRISELVLRRAWGIQAQLLLQPAAIVFAVVGVVIARLLDFSPGFLIGLVIGLELSTRATQGHRVRAILVQYGVILGMSIAAWLGYSLMVATLGDGPGDFVTALAYDTLTAVVAEGLTAIAIGMLPLGFLDGKEIFDSSKKLWVGVFLVIGTAFALLVLPNELSGHEVGNLLIWAIVLVGYAVVTIGLWWVLRVTAKDDDDETLEYERVGG